MKFFELSTLVEDPARSPYNSADTELWFVENRVRKKMNQISYTVSQRDDLPGRPWMVTRCFQEAV